MAKSIAQAQIVTRSKQLKVMTQQATLLVDEY